MAMIIELFGIQPASHIRKTMPRELKPNGANGPNDAAFAINENTDKNNHFHILSWSPLKPSIMQR
ncbi:hypothetical protein HK100_010909, partial [Physocladia obscura]